MTQKEEFTDEERWKMHKAKYNSNNLVSHKLLNNFYGSIEKIISRFDPGDTILELGCGSGDSSMRIFHMLSGQQMEVSDVTEWFVKKLQESDFPLPVRQESVLDLQRESNSVDNLFLLEVLEHLEDYEKALSELFRVARKHVIISVPNEPLWRILNMMRGKYWSQWGNTPAHINHWSAWSIQRLISKYGQIEKVYYPMPWTVVLARVSDPET